MWNAQNLNNLYARFDNKCARALDGKTPFVVGFNAPARIIPFGVEYDYCIDPATSFCVTGSTPTQTEIEIEISKLESKHLDVEGGQVYLDQYIETFDSTYCNVAAIQKSFELHRRTVDDIEYDIHLGWDDWDSGFLSYVRSYFSSVGSVPSLPPGRIHNHKIAVAEIKIEGLLTFKILNSYKRFDCWRVHNCGSNDLKVLLQLPDGSADTHTVPAMGCRSFRRRPDGTWAATWRDGTPCVYFFPYFTGDVPYFAGGPPMYGQVDSLAVCMERSAKANNIANPFLLLQWMRAMGAWVDAAFAYDIRATFPEYSDPTDANTAIGDAIFTWGRARVQIFDITSGGTYQDYIKVFSGVTSFLQTLDDIGVNVVVDGTDLEMSSKIPNAAVRIYPIDCNVFFLENAPFWQIQPTTTYISIAYPSNYYIQDVGLNDTAKVWQPNNTPTWLETMRTLRRRIAVEEGFLNNYDDEVDISEEKVSIVTLSPVGLTARVATTGGIEVYDANALSFATNYERSANVIELRTELRPTGFGKGIYTNTPYISGTKTYILAQPSNYSGMYGNVFPQISTTTSGSYPAVNCAYVPSGGPWGFSSSVYDYNLQRVFTTNPVSQAITGVFGSDFWVNKWGGKDGVDASVRILGQPDQTVQDNGVADDIFKDENNAAMACLAPWFTQVSVSSQEQAYLADIRWTAGAYFKLPYAPTVDAINYDGIGQFYHKIPKSAFLWNLLESHVSGWNRSVPLAHGEVWCPIRKFNAAGVIVPSTMQDVLNKDLTESCLDPSEGPCFFINGNQYYDFLANGIQAKELYDPVLMLTYWLVSQNELASYCRSKGFNSFNFDCSNQVLDSGGGTITPATTWRPMRSYGFGETVQAANYEDVTNGPLYRLIRYVDLEVS